MASLTLNDLHMYVRTYVLSIILLSTPVCLIHDLYMTRDALVSCSSMPCRETLPRHLPSTSRNKTVSTTSQKLVRRSHCTPLTLHSTHTALHSHCTPLTPHSTHTALHSHCTPLTLHSTHTALHSHRTPLTPHSTHTALHSHCTPLTLHSTHTALHSHRTPLTLHSSVCVCVCACVSVCVHVKLNYCHTPVYVFCSRSHSAPLFNE